MVKFNPKNPVDRQLAKKIESVRSKLTPAEQRTLSAEFKSDNPNMGVINKIVGSK